MENTTLDKAKGLGNSVAGNIKQAAGSVVNDGTLQAEGQAQQVKGSMQTATANTKDALKTSLRRVGDLIEKFGDKVEHSVSKNLGDMIEKFGDSIEHLLDSKEEKQEHAVDQQTKVRH